VTTLRTAILVHTGSNHLVVCLLNNRLFKKSTFWCGNGRSHCATLLGRQSQHRLDDPYDDRATQRLFEELLIDRKSLIFNKILTIIHKSLSGEAAAKSDLARNGFVHTVGKWPLNLKYAFVTKRRPKHLCTLCRQQRCDDRKRKVLEEIEFSLKFSIFLSCMRPPKVALERASISTHGRCWS
jgi:hypothetical protein